MSLHDLLDQLAADAPTQGAPAAELWQRGRRVARARRLGTAAIIAVACIGLLLIGTVKSQARDALARLRTLLPETEPVGTASADRRREPGP